MSDSLRPRISNIAAVVGIVAPMLAGAGAIIMAYSDMAVDRSTRSYMDEQHTDAIKNLRADVDALKGDKETARELSALRAQVAALTSTVEALRDEMRRRRR